MKNISKSKLKSKLLELSADKIIVTDSGKPGVKISKYGDSPPTEELFGEIRGKVKYFDDLTTPTIEEWSRF